MESSREIFSRIRAGYRNRAAAWWVWLLVLAAWSTPAPAQSLTDRIPQDPAIQIGRLSNGVTFLVRQNPRPAKRVSLRLAVKAGSIDEADDQRGLAHMLEHMAFKGTPRHPNIPQELTAHGARPNGTTWFDRTNYFETFAATDENLRWALDLEADRMINSFIAEKDLRSEFSVVRNEFESGENNPGRV